MPALEIERLNVETFATTAAPRPPTEVAEKASHATSCPVRPPYCTC
jgi:hypothetical protein